MKKVIIILLTVLSCQYLTAQGVKIGSGGDPDQTSILDLDGSLGKGLLLPRLTNTQMTALNGTDGMLIYNSTDACLYIRKNSLWQKLAEGTPSGGFTFPHTSTHNLPGGYVLDLTNSGAGAGSGSIKAVETANGNAVAAYSESGNAVVGNSNTGTGGYFSSLTGPALITGGGNVGIGVTVPVKSRLHVNGGVGAVSALFENGPGIAIENNHPGIGFNTYYNGGRKQIATGYGAVLSFNPNSGDLVLLNTPASANADAINPTATRMFIDKNGHVGLGGDTNPHTTLSFSDVLGDKISLWGSDPALHYGMGIQSSLFQVYTAAENNDIAFGYGNSADFSEVMRIKGTGKVGIGTTSPAYPLTVNAEGNGIVHLGNSVQMGTSVSAIGGMLRTFTNHSLHFSAGTGGAAQMTLTATGELGVGAPLPMSKIHVRWQNPELLQLDNTNSLAADVKVKQLFRTGSYYTGAIGTTGISASSSRLSFFTGTGLTAGSLTEKMSIDDDGNVGINTLAPTTKLEVTGKTTLRHKAGEQEALILDGAIKVVGADKPAFRVTNTGGAFTNALTINHPLTNNDPSAILIVTPLQATPNMSIHYDVNSAKWMIRVLGFEASGFTTITYRHCNDDYCNTTQVGMNDESSIPPGAAFNVLVIKTN